MGLDIRWPIGLMFSLVGALMFFYGLAPNPEQNQRSLGININLWWGLLLLVFGGFMLLMAWRAERRPPPSEPGPKA